MGFARPYPRHTFDYSLKVCKKSAANTMTFAYCNHKAGYLGVRLAGRLLPRLQRLHYIVVTNNKDHRFVILLGR